MKILVVDDSELVRKFTQDSLEKLGHRVVTVSDIFIAPVVGQFKPDVILMDVTVGTQKGTIAVETLKKHRIGKQAAILLYSAQSPEQLAILARNCGADGFVEKSKDPVQLNERLLQALAQISPPA